MGRRRVASITPAMAGQDMAAILTDFFSVVLLLALNKKYARRAVAVTLVSALEQYCRMVVAEMLARGRGPLPDYVEIPLADAGRIASLPKEVLASFAHSFQSVEAIRRMLRDFGLWDVVKNDPTLLDDLAALFAARNDFVHTSVPVNFDMQAAYDAVLRLFIGIARLIPGLEAEIRLVQGDVFKEMRMHDRSREGYEEAVRLYDAIVRADPSNAKAHAQMGLALAGLGRYEEAVASYDRAESLDAGRAATHLGRGQSLAMMGRYEEAVASYDRAIGLDAALVDAHLLRMIALVDAGRREEALAACERVASLDDPPPRAHMLRGKTLARMGRREEALAAYDKSISMDGYDEAAHLHRANLLAETGRREEALAAYDAAIELDPQYAEAHLKKADLLYDMDEYDESICSYNRAIRLAPGNAGALAGKGRVLERLGRAADAARCYEAVHGLNPARY